MINEKTDNSQDATGIHSFSPYAFICGALIATVANLNLALIGLLPPFMDISMTSTMAIIGGAFLALIVSAITGYPKKTDSSAAFKSREVLWSSAAGAVAAIITNLAAF